MVQRAPDLDPAPAARMSAALAARGPDAQGQWRAAEGWAQLVHRRLAIIDVEGGAQPMASRDGRWVLVYNGEVYNFAALRDELERSGPPLRTRSDTEVVLELLARGGQAALERLEGMFALALIDTGRRSVLLARDRLGQKPLYYHLGAERLLFASNLQSVAAALGTGLTLAPRAIDGYLACQYVPAPLSIYEQIRQLPPAHFLEWRDAQVRIVRWWSPPIQRLRAARTADAGDAVRRLRHAVTTAVRSQLVADVPVGAFLSGGVDSSIIVALMARLAGRRVSTFTIGFADPALDERPWARLVAGRYDTDHHERVVEASPRATLDVLLDTYDEPFADSSGVPTRELAALARERVKVVLGGDAGDELAFGYARYRAAALGARLERGPAELRRGLAAAARRVAAGRWPAALHRAWRFAAGLDRSAAARYAEWNGIWPAGARARLYRPEFAARLEAGPGAFLDDAFAWPTGWRAQAERARRLDVTTYLPGDIFRKLDGATMAVGLEARSPFASRTLWELAAELPLDAQMDLLGGKRLLKAAFADLLPRAVRARPKMGFGVPLDRWLRGPLADDLGTALRTGGPLDAIIDLAFARELVARHAAGRGNHGARLWALLVLARWLERNPWRL